MRHLLIIALSVGLSSFAFATKTKTLILGCQADDILELGAPRYSVEKTTSKSEDGTSSIKYFLAVHPINPMLDTARYELEPIGSGDENYSDYQVLGISSSNYIQRVAIQKEFEWASLINKRGSISHYCESP